MANYYVATAGNGGSNSNPGTVGSPWLTLDFALSYGSLAAGDIINIGAGTFATAANTDISGTVGNPITIRGAGVASTFITNQLTIDKDYYVVEDIAFSVYNLRIGASTASNEGSYNIIQDCAFTGAAQSIQLYYLGSSTDGETGPHDNLIKNCTFASPVGNGMMTTSGHDNIVEYCTFSNNRGYDAIRAGGVRNTYRYNTFTDISNPIVVSVTSATSSGGVVTVVTATPYDIDNGAGVIIAGANEANYNTGGSGRTATVIDATTLTYVPLVDPGDGTATGTITCQGANHADTIQAFAGGGYLTQDIYFIGNTRINCSGQYGNIEGNVGNTEVQRFHFWNNLHINSLYLMNCFVPNCTSYNETIYSDTPQSSLTGFRFVDGSGLSPPRGTANNGVVKNMIALRWNATVTAAPWGFEAGTTGGAASYNLVSTASDGAITGLTNPNGINGGYTPSQVFVTPAAGADLRLIFSSPAVQAGTDLSGTFTKDIAELTRDVPWDMGAYRYVYTTPTRVSLAINAAGTALTLTLSENVDFGAGGNGGLVVTANGTAVGGTYASGSGTTALVYGTLSRTILVGETVTATYTQPTNGIQAVIGDLDLATFTTISVTNNSTATLGTARSARNLASVGAGF